MESRRPRLSPDELQLLRWLLGGTLILLSIATVFYLDIGSEAMAGFAAAGVLLALVRPALPARVPIWAHRLAFPSIVVFFALDLLISRQPLAAVVRLDLLLLLYRGMSHRARRDDLQVIILGLFLIVIGGVLTVSLLFALQILVFTACALALLMVVTIGSSTEGGREPKLAVRGVAPSWAPHADWGRFARRMREIGDWRLAAAAAALFLGVVVLSGFLFLLIPRYQLENSLFLERFVTKRAMTGFNDSIKFGDVTDITQDDGIAFDADLSDPAQAPATPYWRMVVLDEYKNGGFSLSPEMKRLEVFDRPYTGTYTTMGGGAAGAPVWTVYLESGVSRYLPLLGPFNVLHFTEAQRYRLSKELGLISLVDEPATMTAYRVEGMRDAAALPDRLYAVRWRSRAVPGRIPLQVGLDLSADDRAALSRVAAETGADPGAGAGLFAQQVCGALRRQHAYSLSPRIPGGSGDPLVRWMASREGGHCELFAGAFVLIARSAGFPARIITGFKGGTWNGFSGNYTIRNSDAHAWAEIWDVKSGSWLREDPLAVAAETAAETKGDAALARRMDRSWSARISSLRVFWYRRIVNFDQQSQADALKAMKDASDSSGKALRAAAAAAAAKIRAWAHGPWNLSRGLIVAAVAAWTAVITWFLASGRWRMVSLGGGRRGDPVRREAGRWLRRIDGPPALVADLQRLRYGPRPTWPRPMDVFTKARQAARSRKRASSARNTS